MNKRYLGAVLIVGLFFIISANSYDAPPAATEGFQNLKVLPKDITKEKLDSVMNTFAVSLGVKCNFCHAANKDSANKHLDFPSDAKDEKKMARYMFKMVSDLNSNYFNFDHSTRPDTIHAVVCYTCHRGTKEPDSKAFITLIDSTIQSHRKR
jgi:hypothetical protein